MPAINKAQKYLAISAFALCATLFAASPLRAATNSSSDEPQTAAPEATPAPAAAPAAAPTWSVGPIDFSGLVDGYYSFNANHPSTGQNQLRNFDFDANSFSLNMVKLSMAHSPDPVGFQVDLGFGPAFTSANGILGPNAANANIEQAYVALKPTKGKGFEVDFGQFVTSASAEVIETMNNPNYSRSLLFVYMVPYYHVGIRASMPITKTDTGSIMIVNGWNNITDNNAGKSVMLTNTYTKPKYVWTLNYMTGPENTGTDKGFRNLIDTTLNLTPTAKGWAKWTGYINYDYYQNRNAVATSATAFKTTNLYKKQGIAGEARYQATGTLALSGRYEYLADGSDTGDTGATSSTITGYNNATLQEFTVTGEYKMAAGLLARVEYRRDMTDNPYFLKGTRTVKDQSTMELGVVAFFGPKR
jgi:hypothetical protein